MFEPGKPACPVACKYCFITEHDSRRELWNENPIAGINKASTFINVSPWITDSSEEQERFFHFPFEILRGDFVGFTAVTDPFWPKLDKFLWHFIETVSPIAKLVTCVTKWPIGRDVMRKLARVENFRLVVGITGNHPPIEKIGVRKHLDTLRLAKEEGVPTLPISHPYISGTSDLSFLPELKKLGYDEFDVKGLRYCGNRMSAWMPQKSRLRYLGREAEEFLPEDGWREIVSDSGFTLMSPRQWYLREGLNRQPRLSEGEAEFCVKEVMRIANVVTSGDKDSVYRSAINRRL